MKKRALSLLLVVMLLLGLMPASVFAMEPVTAIISVSDCKEIGENDMGAVYLWEPVLQADTTEIKLADLADCMEEGMIASLGDVYVEGTNVAPVAEAYLADVEEMSEWDFADGYAAKDFEGAYAYWIMTDDLDMFFVIVRVEEKENNDPFTVDKGVVSDYVENGYSFTDFDGSTVTADLYTVSVPLGTVSVNLNFGGVNRLAYIYDKNGGFIARCCEDANVGATAAAVKVDANRDGEADVVRVQNVYNADWTGGELLYAVQFVYNYTFTASAGDAELTEISYTPDAYSYLDYMSGNTTTVGVYTISVPEGTENVNLAFSDNVLAYSYTADGNYLSGWYEDYMNGGREATVAVDCNNDSAADYIQIQTPYDASWNSTLLYAITFKTAENTDTPDPDDPDAITPEEAYKASSDKLAENLGEYTYAGQIDGYAVADWYVLGLARAGYEIPDSYYASVAEAVRNGEVTKVTDCARSVLALTAAGHDPRNVGGVNLVDGLNDFGKYAGSNDVIFGLLALDCHDYDSEIRNDLVNAILTMQGEDDAWGYAFISDGEWKTPYGTDVDTTAQAIIALAPYYAENAAVKAAVDKGLKYLASVQNEDGSFNAYGAKSTESTAQVIVALTALGLDAGDAAKGICTMALKDGGFTYGGNYNSLSTSQGYYALVSYFRTADGKTSLYDMSDVVFKSGCPSDKFSDVDHNPDGWYHAALDWAVESGVVNGTSENTFAPNGKCTRAQAITMLWREMDCEKASIDTVPFTDVKADAYYYDALCWAYENGIVNGMSKDSFAPDGVCTRAQIVAMLWRVMGCKQAETKTVPFTDVSSGAYYYDALCWAYENGIIKGMTASTFAPNGVCNRAQMAVILFRAFN